MSRHKRPQRYLDLLAEVGPEWEHGAYIARRAGIKEYNPYFAGMVRRGLIEVHKGFGAYRYRRPTPTASQAQPGYDDGEAGGMNT